MRTLSGRDLTVGYLQKSGFTNPIYVGEKTELDMKMPNAKVKKIKIIFFLLSIQSFVDDNSSKLCNLVICLDILRGGRAKRGWVA